MEYPAGIVIRVDCNDRLVYIAYHAQRMRESSGRSAWMWMAAGGITLGLAIWSMHFIGMLAFHYLSPSAMTFR